MGTIQLEEMEFFAYHGCFHEEQIIGNKFLVSLDVEVDTSRSETSDQLADTVNYQTVYGLVRHEMERKSQLLEHVARRIATAVRKEFPQIVSVRVRISKLNPPLGGKVKQVSFLLIA